jgi:uncharacterized phosphosugar-binding protein
MSSVLPFEFPEQLDRIRENLRAQSATLQFAASLFADTLQTGGLVHVYANGHSRIAVEELCIRMGALTGFHPLLQAGLTTFTDVVGCNGIRLNQAIEKLEGLGEKILAEYDIGQNEPLLIVTATGTTPAAVDMARAWVKRHPGNPLIGLCSAAQSKSAPAKHSSGENLHHVVGRSRQGILIDNGMPVGDMSVAVDGKTTRHEVCPLSSIGALAVVQSLNELTIRELNRRGAAHPVLRNMHLGDTRDTYESWIRDQRARYSRALHRAEVQ